MKLDTPTPELEVSSDLESQGQSFIIGNTGLIFDILRNKLYSDPILAIAREITCNARDAHREVGTGDRPIEVTLPTVLVPEFRVKDYGPGISPQRMDEVYRRYGNSTKRDDNIQHGSFGLGAKCPHSYTDSFTVRTIHQGVQYVYNCVLDPSKEGRLLPAYSEPTDEPNGTEIIIPVLPKDFGAFQTAVETACQFWTVKPILNGKNIKWQKPNTIVAGTNWELTEVNRYDHNSLYVILDGIQYKLGFETIISILPHSPKLISNLCGNLVLYFEVGEINVSASREQVSLDLKTKNSIKSKIQVFLEEVKEKVQQKINPAPTLLDAYCTALETLMGFTSETKHFKFTWKDIPLVFNHDNQIVFPCHVLSLQLNQFDHRCYKNSQYLLYLARMEISHNYGSNISNYKAKKTKNLLFINDTQLSFEELQSRLRFKHFESLIPPNTDKRESITIDIVCPAEDETIEKLNQSIHLNEFKPASLAAQIPDLKPIKKRGPTERLLVFKFVNNKFSQVAQETVEEKPIICRVNKSEAFKERVFTSTNSKLKNITVDQLASFCAAYNLTVYGVDFEKSEEKIKKCFPNYQTIEEVIQTKLSSTGKDFFIKIKSLSNYHSQYRKLFYSDDEKFKSLKNIKTSDNLFVNFFSLRQEIVKKDLFEIYETLHGKISEREIAEFLSKNPTSDLVSIEEKIIQKYPLLTSLNSYNVKISDVITYIRLIDKESLCQK